MILSTTINRDLDIQVEYHITKGFIGNREMPPEPPEVEILSVTCEGKPIELTSQETSDIVEQCFDDAD